MSAVLAELQSKAEDRVSLLAQRLSKTVDPLQISATAKIPYKVLSYREALIWRTEELARAACELYQTDRLAAGIVLTRATTENSAALWYLYDTVRKEVSGAPSPDLDDRIMRLLVGSRNNPTLPSAIQVLTMLDKAEKEVPGIRSSYDRLSEYAHPNWSGTSYLYARIDQEQLLTHYGPKVRGSDEPIKMGLSALIASLLLFDHAYDGISKEMSAFIAVCEQAIDARPK